MDRGAWWATVHGVARVGYNSATNPPVVKNLPANAGDMGSIPGPGRFRMSGSNYTWVPQLLSLGSTAQVLQLLKPVRLKPVVHNKEATAMRSPCVMTKSNPQSPQLEKACPACSHEDPAQPKVKKKKKNLIACDPLLSPNLKRCYTRDSDGESWLGSQ